MKRSAAGGNRIPAVAFRMVADEAHRPDSFAEELVDYLDRRCVPFR